MIMLWNRREVHIGNSLKRFNENCNILSLNGIKYDYRVVDNNGASFLGGSRRARTGTFGENMEISKTYYIYVHKDNYEEAYELLRK